MALSTLNAEKEDCERITRLRLKYAAAQAKAVTSAKYLKAATDILEHLDKCTRCADVVDGCIKRGDKI